MKRWLLTLLLVGCAKAPTMEEELTFAPHFPGAPAVTHDGARTEYHLATPDYDYTAGLIRLTGNEPLRGKTFLAEGARLKERGQEERPTPFYGVSAVLSGPSRMSWLTQSGDGRVLYVTVKQLKPNPDRPLELPRVFQEFTEGAKL